MNMVTAGIVGIGYVVSGPVTLTADQWPVPWQDQLACDTCGQTTGPWLLWTDRNRTGATCHCGTNTELGAAPAEVERAAGELAAAPPEWTLSALQDAFVTGTAHRARNIGSD